jgi:hypothetical protein
MQGEGLVNCESPIHPVVYGFQRPGLWACGCMNEVEGAPGVPE